MTGKDIASPDKNFFEDIRGILRTARSQAYAQVNTTMVKAYWQIGQRIVIQEQKGKDRADYGSFLIRNLFRDLVNEFGKGFSVANLWNFRQFYLVFPDEEKLYTVCRGLSWSHIRLIMRLDNANEGDYYIAESREQNWSVRQLERNIKSGYFQRLLSTQNKEITTGTLQAIQSEFLKDPYVLEFLGLPESSDYKESALEQAIISNLQKFLLELGKGFSFTGRQFRYNSMNFLNS